MAISELSWSNTKTAVSRPRHFAHPLTIAFRTATRIPFDQNSRFILFSDCHRGDGSPPDAFVPNESLFLHALRYYNQQQFSYIEVGDGDDLWKHPRFCEIRQAHSAVFDLFHQFFDDNRLHLLFGNHDLPGGSSLKDKDGIPTQESLVLHHTQTGQEIFITHGHQVDSVNGRFALLSRLFVRHIWQRLQHTNTHWVKKLYNWSVHHGLSLERVIIAWAQKHQQIVICGHTHIPHFNHTLYFNTGSCVQPGELTGLEIQGGQITQVKWQNGRFPARYPLTTKPLFPSSYPKISTNP